MTAILLRRCSLRDCLCLAILFVSLRQGIAGSAIATTVVPFQSAAKLESRLDCPRRLDDARTFDGRCARGTRNIAAHALRNLALPLQETAHYPNKK